MHEVVRGAAQRSWGVHVARLAGVPETVVKRAEVLLKAVERNTASTSPLPLFAPEPAPMPEPGEKLMAALEELDPDKMTPREALAALYELRSKMMTAQGMAV